MSNEVLATIYYNGPNWEARILEPGKEPYYFMPPGTTMTKRRFLEAGILDSFEQVQFVDELMFAAQAAIQQED